MADPDAGVVRFLPEGTAVPFRDGETILAHALRAGVPLLAPCGGEGRCGKCRVVASGSTRGGDDPGLLSPGEIRAGLRLACRCVPLSGGVTARVLPESRPARLAAYIDGREMAEDGPFVPLHPASARGRPLGAAVDLGTSTLAGALVDLADGAVLARAAVDNPQMACGEDLISRIVYGEENEGGFVFLRRLLLGGIERLVADLRAAAAREGEIVEVVASGNTVMSHVLYGLSPASIRKAPYRPVLREYPETTGRLLGIDAAAPARWRIFPSVGGFVGGDVVADILASGLHRDETVSLLFDVGTNGEVVLGSRTFRIACSSSAGPAFEGGEVACGMRAYPGAIETVRIEPGSRTPSWTVLGGGKPAGLCGSGILDLCAELFRTGIIDRTGRIVASEGADIADTERGKAYVLVGADRSATGARIALTASDIKSVMRTKAALCAAADALLAAVGLSREDVSRVFIAGGFGNFIDLRSALTLGVFPPFPLSSFVPLGNASLAGAIGALRSRRRFREAVDLAAGTAYHDLSSDPGFMDLYQRALFIPHTDAESFRAVLAVPGAAP